MLETSESEIVQGYIVGIRIDRRGDGDERATTVELDLAATLDPGAKRMMLTFDGAIQVRVGDLDGYGFSLLEISSIRDRGWDRIAYAVRDAECDVVELKCRRWSRSNAA